jgi:hypothetical protein
MRTSRSKYSKDSRSGKMYVQQKMQNIEQN